MASASAERLTNGEKVLFASSLCESELMVHGGICGHGREF